MIDQLRKHNMFYGSGVPCSIFKNELARIEAHKEFTYIPAVDERTAIGLVNGLNVGGKKAFLITQNSAIGTVCDIIGSFNIPYKVPLFWFLSVRGYEEDTEVHKWGGSEIMFHLITSIGFRYFSNQFKENYEDLNEALDTFKSGKSVVFLLHKGCGYAN